MKICSIDGCDRKYWARDWYSLHYQRWWKRGDPEVTNGTGRTRVDYTDQITGFIKWVEPTTEKYKSTGSILWRGECLNCGRKDYKHSPSHKKQEWLHGYPAGCGCLNRDMPESTKAIRFIIRSYKRAAKIRELLWELTYDQCSELFVGNCVYCNQEPSRQAKHGIRAYDFFYNGIDRVDNNRGYTPENVASCCSDCNRAKLIMTEKEYIEHCQRVVDHQKDLK